MAAAQALYESSQSGGPAAGQELARRLAEEPDPRVRFTLAHGVAPDLPRPRPNAPPLPAAAAQTPAGVRSVYWLPPNKEGVYQSRIEISAEGRVQVETTFEQTNGPTWTVRYGGWSWQTADGRTVLDARDQPVELVQVPAGGWWSPDSMVIDRQGLVDLLDDDLAPAAGTLESPRDG